MAKEAMFHPNVNNANNKCSLSKMQKKNKRRAVIGGTNIIKFISLL
jgi:hypothetical protein